MNDRPIAFFHTHVAEAAIERVTAVLRWGWLNEGEVVREFEAELHRVLGVANPVTVNSGTAALGLGNLSDFPARLARRRALAARYRAVLADVPGLRLIRVDADREPAWWFFDVLVERRPEFGLRDTLGRPSVRPAAPATPMPEWHAIRAHCEEWTWERTARIAGRFLCRQVAG